MKANIPKFITKFLVNKTLDEMNPRLQIALRREKDVVKLVSENDDIKKTREIADTCISKLERAIWAIKNVARYHHDLLKNNVFDDFE